MSTGASNDIEKATSIARNMVITYGMSESFGPLMLSKGESGFLGSNGESNPYSERTAEAIDAEERLRCQKRVHRLVRRDADR